MFLTCREISRIASSLETRTRFALSLSDLSATISIIKMPKRINVEISKRGNKKGGKAGILGGVGAAVSGENIDGLMQKGGVGCTHCRRKSLLQ